MPFFNGSEGEVQVDRRLVHAQLGAPIVLAVKGVDVRCQRGQLCGIGFPR